MFVHNKYNGLGEKHNPAYSALVTPSLFDSLSVFWDEWGRLRQIPLRPFFLFPMLPNGLLRFPIKGAERKNMKRIVIYTGSFNPVTKAHFEILSKTVKTFQAEEGLFVLTPWGALNLKCRSKQHQNFILKKEVREEVVKSLSNYDPKIRF